MRLPPELTAEPRWVLWREVTRPGDDKPRKMPFDAHTGEPASSTDPETWSTYADAIERYESEPGAWSGLGFVLGGGFAGVDMDDAIIDGELHPDARAIVDLLDSYTEISPSGQGVKIIAKGTKPGTRCKSRDTGWGGAVELYDGSRFFTITGDLVEGSPVVVADASDALAALYHHHFPRREPPAQPVASVNGHICAGVDDRVERCRRYLLKMQPSISGEGGHDRCFHAACVCYRFDLGDSEALEMMRWWSDHKSDPPWDERDLRHKIESAREVVSAEGGIGSMRCETPRPRVLDGGPRDDAPIDAPDSIHPSPLDPPPGREDFSTGIRYCPTPISKLGPPEPVRWVWPGYIAEGAITLITAEWKSGKTTMISHLVRDFGTGGGLVDRPVDGNVLIVSEEPKSLWTARCDALGIGDHLHITPTPVMGRPSDAQWEEFVDCIARDVVERGYRVVILDTLTHIWPCKEENDAGQVTAAVTPLRRISEAGAGLLLVHHPPKGDEGGGIVARGSGAIQSFPDVLVTMRKFDKQSASDTRRVLTAIGRMEGVPAERVFDLTDDDGYIMLGEPMQVRGVDRDAVILDILNKAGEPLTPAEVKEKWPKSERAPGKNAIPVIMKRGGVAGIWRSVGGGVCGDPLKYTLAG